MENQMKKNMNISSLNSLKKWVLKEFRKVLVLDKLYHFEIQTFGQHQKDIRDINRWYILKVKGIKIITLIICTVLLFLFFISCATTSLHSPKPNKPGKFSIGAHGGYIIMVADGEFEPYMPMGNITMRIGIFNGGELGLNIGTIGGDLAFKYGFMDYENPFQLSVFGGAGLYMYQMLHLNIGILTGYEISKYINIYGGYRQFFYPAVFSEFDSLGTGDIIVGLELFPKKIFSPMLEFDYNFFMFGPELNEMQMGYFIINAGFNINF